MDELVQWLITHVLAAIALPMFVIAVLCYIAGIQPDRTVGGFLRLLVAIANAMAIVIAGVLRLMLQLVARHLR